MAKECTSTKMGTGEEIQIKYNKIMQFVSADLKEFSVKVNFLVMENSSLGLWINMMENSPMARYKVEER